MSDFAVQTVGLGKMYRIGSEREKYRTLRDTLVQAAKRPLERIRHPGAATHSSEILWALRDIDVNIEQGESVGIIGRNGAGKSTLLKILSHITEPSEGRVELCGRVASLLEVGTGFHGELTGRENIQLNGAILGMTRAEIKRKFDEIVEFSEIGRFLDTPVKRYSSGMYVRLAFAVAAHLDPDILVVDEVLAVGDAEFQSKCLGKMSDVAHGGRTVLFVSHNMAAVSNLCERGLVLDGGRLVADEPVSDAITRYLQMNVDDAAIVDLSSSDRRPAWAEPWIRGARLGGVDGSTRREFMMGEDVVVEFEFATPGNDVLRNPIMGVEIVSPRLGVTASVNSRQTGTQGTWESLGTGVLRCRLRRPPLLAGSYIVDLWLGDAYRDVDCVHGAFSFQMIESDVYGTGRPPFRNKGVFFLDAEFEQINPNSALT